MIANNTDIPEQHIAWQGWQIPIEPDWQPMRIEGDHKSGTMIIGTSETPLLQVRWQRLKSGKDMTAETWLRQRFRLLPGAFSDNAPLPEGFDDSKWVKDMALKRGNSKTVWVGVSKKAGVLIDIMLTNLTPTPEAYLIVNNYLPQLKVFPTNELWRWCLYQVDFQVPGEYHLVKHNLVSGDAALFFRKSRSEQLLVRQVYPSKLALARRSMGRWLDVVPFKEKRRYKLDKEEEWHDDSKHLNGICRHGRRQIAFPFGWIARRSCSAIVAEDKELERLLIAEHICGDGADDQLVENTIAGMNTFDV